MYVLLLLLLLLLVDVSLNVLDHYKNTKPYIIIITTKTEINN